MTEIYCPASLSTNWQAWDQTTQTAHCNNCGKPFPLTDRKLPAHYRPQHIWSDSNLFKRLERNSNLELIGFNDRGRALVLDRKNRVASHSHPGSTSLGRWECTLSTFVDQEERYRATYCHTVPPGWAL